jgi:hypothetical protein
MLAILVRGIMGQEFNMNTVPHEEFQDFILSVAKLRQHLVADPEGTALMEDALNTLCRYYNSDPVARAGRYLIQNVLSQHPHLHHTETRVADWGFEFVVSCDNCGKQETHKVVNSAVDIASALMLGKHEACKPKLVIEPNKHSPYLVN